MKLASDRKYAIFILFLSVGYCLCAYLLDTDFEPTNEKFYPFVLAVVMVVQSVALFVWPSELMVQWPQIQNVRRICILFCSVLIYSLILHRLGFIPAAILLMISCMWVFEANRKWIIPVSVITALIFYIVFDKLLGLALPTGILFFL